MEQEQNLKMLENWIKELYSNIKIITNEYTGSFYKLQVELDGQIKSPILIRRWLVDDKIKDKILAVFKERLG